MKKKIQEIERGQSILGSFSEFVILEGIDSFIPSQLRCLPVSRFFRHRQRPPDRNLCTLLVLEVRFAQAENLIQKLFNVTTSVALFARISQHLANFVKINPVKLIKVQS